MMRLLHGISYLVYIAWAIITGTAQVAFRLFRTRRPYAQPMIVEVPLRCRTDLEVTLFSSSITITPGTLVTAIAAGSATTPPVLFVHCLFEDSEEAALAGLYDMESRLLAMTRGRAPQSPAPGAAEVEAALGEPRPGSRTGDDEGRS